VTAAIAIGDLRVVRGGREVLPGISFEVEQGAVTGLLGPSGSGKSTLMRAVVGVQRVASGSLDVLGLPAGDRALRPRVAYMTQELSVYRDLTVRENLRYFARILDAPRGTIDEVIAQVDLEAHADHQVQRLSGGEQARVSLATALVGAPELLVLDEPTVGLDPLLRRRLWELFGELARGGRTLLISSHVMDEAAHCDSLILLREGCVLASGRGDALLARTGAPDLESAFVALIESEAGG
jgi:ABC-2 type transport system ATP-binding protein